MSTRKPKRHRIGGQINQTLRHARNTPSARGDRKRVERRRLRESITKNRTRYRDEYAALSPLKRGGKEERRLRRLAS